MAGSLETIQKVVGRRIREARESVGMTQEELGSRLTPYLGKGWSKQTVSAVENGGRAIGVDELAAFTIELGHSVSWFLWPETRVDFVQFSPNATDRRGLVDIDRWFGRLLPTDMYVEFQRLGRLAGLAGWEEVLPRKES